MLKIKIIIESNRQDYLNGWRFDDELFAFLADRDIEIGENVENPDILFFSVYLSEGKRLPEGNLPIILCDSNDEGHLLIGRSLINDPRVVAVLKVANYVNLNLHNTPYVCDPCPSSYHRTIIKSHLYESYEQRSFYPSITEDDYGKIRVFCGFARTIHEYQLSKIHDISNKRDIKLHGVMCLKYDGAIIEKHRLLCKEAIDKWLLNYGSSAIVGFYDVHKRSLDKKAYIDSMMNCNTVISPWGWGEYCIRDFEALVAGCVLIKPDSSFSQTWPELIPDVHYIPVKPDFSNLDECIEKSFSPEWNNLTKRSFLKNHVLQAWDVKIIGDRFLNILKEFNLFKRKKFEKYFN